MDILQQLAIYAQQIISKPLTDEQKRELMDTCHKIAECNNALVQYVRSDNDFNKNVQRKAIDAWSKSLPTPQEFKDMYRRNPNK